MDDEDCDSTWEEEEEGQEKENERKSREEEKPRQHQRGNQAFQNRMIASRNWRAVQDMQRYRHGYPDLIEEDCSDEMMNLKFYKNEIAFLPNGIFIEEILKNWKGEYDILEDNHSYIQWLFPLRERGVNWHAKPLTLREIQEFKKSPEVMKRFVQAYELMLDFYGIELENHKTGKVRKADNYQKRFQNLNLHSHNNLRLTRILKCLGEMGYEHYQVPLVHFFLEEILVNHYLPSVKQSALDYFMFTVRNKKERRKLVYYAWKNFSPQQKFAWGPHEKLKKFEPEITPSLQQDPLEEEGSGGPANEIGIEKDQVRTEVKEEIVGDGITSQDKQIEDKDPNELQSFEMEKGESLNSLDQQEGKVATRSTGDQESKPQSPKESKKRKYEISKVESNQEEEKTQGTSDVEKIAHNLEECALSQSSQGISSESGEMGNLGLPRERGPSSLESMETKMSNEKGKKMNIESEAQKTNIKTTDNRKQSQGTSDVEKIAHNLEECALSQSSQGIASGSVEMEILGLPRERGPSSPESMETKMSDEKKKKRKFESEAQKNNINTTENGKQNQSTSDVEKIAHNLEECALSQSSQGIASASEEMEILDLPRERGPSSPESMETEMFDEKKKRRKFEPEAQKNTIKTTENGEQNQGTSDGEKIASNLKECACSQGIASAFEEMGSLGLPRERGPSSPECMETEMSEKKKRRLESEAQKSDIKTRENGEQTPTCLSIPNGILHEAEKLENKSSIGWEAKSLQAEIVKHDGVAVVSSGNPSGDSSNDSMSPEQLDLKEYIDIEKGSINTNPELKRPEAKRPPREASGAECSDEAGKKAGDETTVERPCSE